MKPDKKNTSWEAVGKWYGNIVGEEGHYYHQKIILPGVLRLMQLEVSSEDVHVLDLACGQGVLARQLPENTPYTGIDISNALIQQAKKLDKNPIHKYLVSDITKPIPLKDHTFSHASIILALQNIENPQPVFLQLHRLLKENGQLIVVLNHPSFRIPRQSSWQVDQTKKIQYRRLDRYMSPLRIPIQAHPSKQGKSETTWSFHYPLSAYSEWLFKAGFVIELIEEWCSDKVSVGGAAAMENRSRAEFPLFLTIQARKRSA